VYLFGDFYKIFSICGRLHASTDIKIWVDSPKRLRSWRGLNLGGCISPNCQRPLTGKLSIGCVDFLEAQGKVAMDFLYYRVKFGWAQILHAARGRKSLALKGGYTDKIPLKMHQNTPFQVKIQFRDDIAILQLCLQLTACTLKPNCKTACSVFWRPSRLPWCHQANARLVGGYTTIGLLEFMKTWQILSFTKKLWHYSLVICSKLFHLILNVCALSVPCKIVWWMCEAANRRPKLRSFIRLYW